MPEGGVCRPAYSEAYFHGVEYVKSLMEQAGMDVRVDRIGNVIGTYAGETDRILLAGSHIDSVPYAGMFDGCLGVLGAIEAVRTLHENKKRLRHTLQVAAFAEEEGNTVVGLLGSAAFAGILALKEEAKQRLATFGLNEEDALASKSQTLDRVDAYLELHIEQGGVLDAKGIDIGVVNGIVGIQRYDVVINGKSNHAGTTPMSMRDDAMVKAANMIVELDKLARETDPEMVYTSGYVHVKPGASNVIPGQVVVCVEARAMRQASLDIIDKYLKNRFAAQEATIIKLFAQPPVPMAAQCKDSIKRAADELKLTSINMNSGAGHDTMAIAEKVNRCGMIFVPSKDGISHSPDEWTEWRDAANGANVLLNALIGLDES